MQMGEEINEIEFKTIEKVNKTKYWLWKAQQSTIRFKLNF